VSSAPPERRDPPARGEATRVAVLEATLGLVAEQGYAFAMEDVAVRAGVNRTTVHRRWRSKAVLVGAALEHAADVHLEEPGPGPPLVAIADLAAGLAAWLATPAGSGCVRAVVAAAIDDPDLRVVARDVLERRYRTAEDLLEAARDRGELRSGVDTGLVWRAIANPLHLAVLMGSPLSIRRARRIVALVLDGARTPVAASPA
jgi:AcrR family transcriptional regulator